MGQYERRAEYEQKLKASSEAWRTAPEEMRARFLNEMARFDYGSFALLSAWAWFRTGAQSKDQP